MLAESFFSSLKSELVNHGSFKSRAETNTVVFEYIEVFYNPNAISPLITPALLTMNRRRLTYCP